MGWKIKIKKPKFKNPFGGRNSFVRTLGRDIDDARRNPTRAVNNALGTKIPESIKIGGTSIGLSPKTQVQASLRDIERAGQQAGRDYKNFERSEPGKWVGGLGRSAENVTLGPLRAVSSGDYRGESLKMIGSTRDLITGGFESYVGQNSWAQRQMRSDEAKSWTLGFSENWAGQTRGTHTLARTGDLSNDDRNNWIQAHVKSGAVIGAIYGGGAIAGAGGQPATGAVLVETGSVAPLGSSAAITSTNVGLGTGAAAAGGGTAAAAGGSAAGSTGLMATLGETAKWTAIGGIGAQVLSGQKSPQAGFTEILTGGGYNPEQDTSGLWDQITGLFQGDDGAPSKPNALAGLLPQTDTGKKVFWVTVTAMIAAGIYVRYRRVAA